MSQKTAVMELCLSLDTGGLERLVVNLANQLAENPSIEAHICTVGKTQGEIIPAAISPSVSWTELHGPPFCNFKTAFKLAAEIRRRRIKLIHAHGSNPLVYALCASLFTGVPIVFTKHSTYDDLDFFKRHKYFNALACRRVSRFVGVSKQTTGMLKDVFKPAAARCQTLFNGTELPPVELREKARILRQITGADAPFIIATVCRLAHEKDLSTLLWAFARVREVQPQSELWIVGDGVEREKLTALAAQLKLDESVKFLGFSGKVHEILAKASLFVNSSLTEGISLSILEAMSLGLPIVATNVGGTPSVVNEGQNGLLVEPRSPHELASAILRLARDRELCRHMGDNSANLARRNWSLEHMADSYCDLYEQILGAGRRVPMGVAS